jgi:hypothetical protein
LHTYHRAYLVNHLHPLCKAKFLCWQCCCCWSSTFNADVFPFKKWLFFTWFKCNLNFAILSWKLCIFLPTTNISFIWLA